MIKKMSVEWDLRLRMAERGHYATTDLVPLLGERGVHLSREQVYRLVTSTPQRLSTATLAALCDILECTPNDLLRVVVVDEQVAKPTGTTGPTGSAPAVQRTRIRRPGHAG